MKRRNKRDSNVSWSASDKAHRSVPTSCLDPLESKLGFSHMSIFSQSAERAARAAPNGVKKGATFLLVFRCLNHTASSRKAFNGVQKGQVHSKKHKPSKKYFYVDDRFRGHHPRTLKTVLFIGSFRARKIFSVILAKVEVNRKFQSPKWQ